LTFLYKSDIISTNKSLKKKGVIMSNESSGKSFFHTFISVGMIIFIIAVIFLLFTGIKGCIEYRQVYYPGVGWVTEPRK